MTHIVVQADDLSGAAETAQCFVRRGLRTVLVLARDGASSGDRTAHSPEADVVVHDTHPRGTGAAEARRRTGDVFRDLPPGPDTLVLKKIDSLWRGNIHAEISALTAAGHHVVVAGALPHLGRAVLDGRPVVDGVPLAATERWQAEAAPPPTDLRVLLRPDAPEQVRHLPLALLRSADRASRLAERLSGPDPVVLLVDGETDADLDLVVEFLLGGGSGAGGRRVVLAGTGAAAVALADRCAPPAAQHHADAHNAQNVPSGTPEAPGGGRGPRSRPGLAVVGTASAPAHRQLGRPGERGFLRLRIPAADPSAPEEALLRCRPALAAGSAASSPPPRPPWSPPARPPPPPPPRGSPPAWPAAPRRPISCCPAGGRRARC
ncbi:four-carbon acid sugar kinase family protein [Arthrobacter sp. RIT-PI-e]|uniref:four-carbon acid sugar kinase family protein n=1 Tax=Arthrobacter sp. RIT-PI-e TaxID=1681197 RepID=UPI0006761C2E|nr:four-carbon acid sugar kinase family protein [Arthrobacter sp. RIT-PI-e]